MQFIPPETLTLMLNSIIDKKDSILFDIQFLSGLQKVTLENQEFLTFIVSVNNIYISQAERKLSGELDAKIIVSVKKIYLYERVFICQ